jgi:peptidoglycan biosynthesis protein MviN/MurJ (putative lipid II flippase)
VWILVAMTGVNALLDAVLVQFMGLFGIALATTIAAAARTFLLLAVIAPGVLARRDLWAGMARMALAGVVLHGGLVLLMPGGAPTGWVALFGRLALAGIASGALLCLLWPVVLRAEVRSLHGLRRRVAADAARVDGKPRGE